MSQAKSKSSRSYTRHSADYKKEALRLAEVHGVSKAASDLKLSESQIMLGECKSNKRRVSVSVSKSFR